jgi:hypothetical protein
LMRSCHEIQPIYSCKLCCFTRSKQISRSSRIFSPYGHVFRITPTNISDWPSLWHFHLPIEQRNSLNHRQFWR